MKSCGRQTDDMFVLKLTVTSLLLKLYDILSFDGLSSRVERFVSISRLE